MGEGSAAILVEQPKHLRCAYAVGLHILFDFAINWNHSLLDGGKQLCSNRTRRIEVQCTWGESFDLRFIAFPSLWTICLLKDILAREHNDRTQIVGFCEQFFGCVCEDSVRTCNLHLCRNRGARTVVYNIWNVTRERRECAQYQHGC